MPASTVVLTEHHATVLDRLVTSGRYASARAALDEGLRLLERHEQLEASKTQALRQAAAAGFADLDSGRFVPIEDAAIDRVLSEPGQRALKSRS